MGMTAEQYLAQLQALLPSGAVWPRDQDAELTQALYAWADELARIDGRAGDVLAEMDPRVTSEMLAEWEEAYGLPDECLSEISTEAGRRESLLARYIATGGQSAQYFIDLAASFGYTITVSEFFGFGAGQPCNAFVADDSWAYFWLVTTQTGAIREFRAGAGRAGERLRDWDRIIPMECIVSRFAPAHTVLLFGYEVT